MNLGIILYQPEIAANVGSILRTSACLGAEVHLIRPLGFVLYDAKLKRVSLNYMQHVQYKTWDQYDDMAIQTQNRRKIAFIVPNNKIKLTPYYQIMYQPSDMLIFGSESSGLPCNIIETADIQTTIPIVQHLDSLNVSVAAGIAMAEAMRQINIQNIQN